jgi:ribosomal 30S subunit maturation factor RimM
METAAHAVLRIKTEGKDILIPYVDAFILDVNDKKNQIKIKWMEGL